LRTASIGEGRAQPIPKTLTTLPNADQIQLSGDRQLAIDSSQGGDTISRSLPTPEAVMSRPLLPPFTRETAAQKARMAEDAWNSRDPERVALAYTEDSRWCNRSEFFEGRAAIVAFLTRKWAKEHEYRLIKDLWAFDNNRIAVRFQYEWHDDAGQWHRSYGNEQWEFDEHGLMRRREASINDVAIAEADRRFRWAAPGPRLADVPGLGESPF
jgi:nuclear transport factor 2 (NTF2) superfamily protein